MSGSLNLFRRAHRPVDRRSRLLFLLCSTLSQETGVEAPHFPLPILLGSCHLVFGAARVSGAKRAAVRADVMPTATLLLPCIASCGQFRLIIPGARSLCLPSHPPACPYPCRTENGDMYYAPPFFKRGSQATCARCRTRYLSCGRSTTRRPCRGLPWSQQSETPILFLCCCQLMSAFTAKS